MMNSNQGQGIVEYVLMFTVVLVVLIGFLSPRRDVVKQPLLNLYETATNTMSNVAGTIFSH